MHLLKKRATIFIDYRSFLCLENAAKNVLFILEICTFHFRDYIFYFLTFMVVGMSYSNILAQDNGNVSFDALLQEGSLPVQFTNDSIYPWTIGEDGVATSGNVGVAYSSSSLLFSYESEYQTELTFSWLNYSSSNHTLKVYVDGAYYANYTSSSWGSKRLYIPKGTHIVEFKDSIMNSTSTSRYSQLKQIKITEIKELESVVLSTNSKPLTFKNDSVFPWILNDGYISSTNYGTANSASRFSTSFTIDTPSKFAFSYALTGNSSGTGYHYLRFNINGVQYSSNYGNDGTYYRKSVLLEPGDYTIEWVDTIYNTTNEYVSHIKNIELSDNWLNIEVSTPGTLGVEVLYQVDVLNDVELLKVVGTINETDWTSIKNMKNLIGLDLSEARFDAVPDYAFDGLNRLSNVELPEGMKTIGEYAFKSTSILNIDIPNSVTSLGKDAFAGTPVRTVNFTAESQLQLIGYRCFYQCSSLVELIMPNTVTSLDTYNSSSAYTFYDCTSLRRLHFSDAIIAIPGYTCYECNNLTDVHLPQNLNTIQAYAFYKTSSLHTLVLPESLRSIERGAFVSSGLDSLILPIKLKTLYGSGSYDGAFYNCDNLKYIELPSNISSYNGIFAECGAIQTVVCKSATPPVITNDPFSDGPAKSNITLIVPSFAVANYKLDTYWCQFGNIQEIDVDLDYWRISGDLMLTNNRRMNGTPDIDLYYGGRLTVGGNAPMAVGDMKVFVSEGNLCCLLNSCEQFTVDSLTTCYSVSSGTWCFFTPLHDVKLSDITHSANASYVFRYYNAANRATSGSGNSWQNVVSDKLIAGQGYIFHCNADGAIYLPATQEAKNNVLVTSEVTKTLETHEAENTANANWNYVGNPYPCYYDIYYMDFTAPITVWNSSSRTYQAYSITDDDYVLRPMQSFFVQKPAAVDNIVFRPEGRQISSTVNRASYAPAKRKNAGITRHIYNLEISGSDAFSDQTRIVLNETKSLAYEMECDASKFMSMDTSAPQIFTIDAEDNRLAINERPKADGAIRLGISAGTAGTYTIAATRADGDLVLYDAETGTTTDLATESYTFETEAGESVHRFTLNAKPRTTTDIASTVEESNIVVSGAQGIITINGANDADIKVFTVSGALIHTVENATTTCTINVEKGVYVVAVNGEFYKTVVL